MSTVLEDTNPFENVLGFASMLGEMVEPCKSWGNSIEFNEGADKIGVDVMRWAFVATIPKEISCLVTKLPGSKPSSYDSLELLSFSSVLFLSKTGPESSSLQ